jgi:acetyltransferase-like isoleucine patch superfamily enzyme
MRIIINKIITKIKGSNYEIDKQIPLSYFLSLSIRRIFMLIRGFLRPCKKKGILFLGNNTKIYGSRLLFTGKYVTIDRNCFIDALSTEGIHLGDNVSIGKNTTIECTGNLQFIGKGLKVRNNVGLGTHGYWGCAGGIEVGEDTIFGNFVSLHSENHNYEDPKIPIRLQGVNHKGITIGKNCWIGSKATILDGAIIEDGCIIAAGSLVTSGIYLKNSIYGGVPAKKLKDRC